MEQINKFFLNNSLISGIFGRSFPFEIMNTSKNWRSSKLFGKKISYKETNNEEKFCPCTITYNKEGLSINQFFTHNK